MIKLEIQAESSAELINTVFCLAQDFRSNANSPSVEPAQAATVSSPVVVQTTAQAPEGATVEAPKKKGGRQKKADKATSEPAATDSAAAPAQPGADADMPRRPSFLDRTEKTFDVFNSDGSLATKVGSIAEAIPMILHRIDTATEPDEIDRLHETNRALFPSFTPAQVETVEAAIASKMDAWGINPSLDGGDANDDAGDDEAITETALKARLQAIMEVHADTGYAALVELLAKFGVDSLKKMPVDKYPAFSAALSEVESGLAPKKAGKPNLF